MIHQFNHKPQNIAPLLVLITFSIFNFQLLIAQEESGAGYALHFNDPNVGVRIPDSPSLDMTTEITAIAWVHPTAYGNHDKIVLKNWTSDADPWSIWRLTLTNYNNGNEKAVFNITTGGIDHTVESSVSIKLNEWTHIAGTYNGNSLNVYVNGILAGTKILSGNIDTNNEPVTIGRQKWNNWNELIGYIDEVSIWNIALSETEIRNFMSQKLSGNETGLAAYFPMDEGEDDSCPGGKDVCDKSKNGNHGIKY